MPRLFPFSLPTLALLISALLCGAGCRRAATIPPGYIQVDIETSPLNLDPRFATDAISGRIDELMFDSLVRLDQHQRFVGDLADQIERPGPTRLVFHLRRDVRFSDGRPLTARDIKYTYESTIDPRSLSSKRAGFAELAAIDTPDDFTVVFTTRGPYAPALEMAMLGIVPNGAAARPRGTVGTPLGSGPFMLTAFVRDDQVLLRRNPYLPATAGTPAGIRFKIVPDPTVRALELVEGSCDLAENNIEPDLLAYLGRKPALVVDRYPGTAYQYLAFNFRDARLRDLRVRQAIAYAIDRRAIIDHLRDRTARAASGMLSPENEYYRGDVKLYPYDPTTADRLLDAAGYPRAADGMRALEFVYKTTPEGARLAEVFQAMLRRVGIQLRVRVNEFGTFYGDIARGNFDLTSMQWVGINDPHHYYMVFDSRMTPPRGLNRGDYANPEMDRLVEAGDAELNSDRRRAIYLKVQQLAAADLPYVSLWWQDNVVVMQRGLDGLRPYPNGSLRSLTDITSRREPTSERAR
ncbi:MAG: ABC transporter substrate-binding protein [Candidatus Binataceae bacterium]|nr:ABC transporter substrate-binding protein [Candidatus Binataceae bacterium]